MGRHLIFASFLSLSLMHPQLMAFQICAHCDCIIGTFSQVSVANCPNIDPKVTQFWTICGEPEQKL